MGIIQRQGAKQSLVNLAGIVIGMISGLLIYPLEEEAYGLAQFLISTATLLLPFASLGASSTSIKFFPEQGSTKSNTKGRGLYAYLLIQVFLGSALVFILLFLFKDPILAALQRSGMEAERLSNNLTYIAFIALFLALIRLTIAYTSNFGRIVVPAILETLFIKITLPLLVLAIYFAVIDRGAFRLGVVLMYGASLIFLVLYLRSLGGFDWRMDPSFFQKSRTKRMATYSVFSLFTALGSLLAFRIDGFMIPMLMDFSITGFYFIVLFIAGIIEIPARAIIQISSPIISGAWEREDRETIQTIYSKSALNLLIIGLLLYLEALLCISFVLDLMEQYRGESVPDSLFWVLVFLGGAKLIDLTTSINSQIIAYSKAFQFNLLVILLLGISSIFLNYLFIPQFGLPGAALATLIAIFLYNLAKFLFIFFKYGMQPFSWSILTVLLIGGSLFFPLFWWTPNANPVLVFLFKGGLFALLYVGLIYRLTISPDFNQLLSNIWETLLRFLRRG